LAISSPRCGQALLNQYSVDALPGPSIEVEQQSAVSIFCPRPRFNPDYITGQLPSAFSCLFVTPLPALWGIYTEQPDPMLSAGDQDV